MNIAMTTPHFDSSIETLKGLPGIREVIEAARLEQISKDERRADELDAEFARLSAGVEKLRASATPRRAAAEARVAEILDQLAAARAEVGKIDSELQSQESELIAARRAAYREAHQLRERVATARGERRPLSEAELKAIKAPEIAPLFDPGKPQPRPVTGFIMDWQR